MIEIKDQTGRIITLNSPAKRIVSVVPSQTELLFDLGLREEIIGVTWFCIHPKNLVKNVEKVGGTKKLDIEKIKLLNPEIIIANKEENTREQIEELEKYFPIYISDIVSLEDAYGMIKDVGVLVGKEAKSAKIITEIKVAHSDFLLRKKSPSTPPQPLKTLYLIWQNPYMSIGKETFISTMLSVAGFENVCAEKSRYPELTIEEIKDINPEVVLLSSEPFPFNEKHIEEWQKLLTQSKIILVDGEMFSWYGSRLRLAFEYLKSLT
ncbi:MAG: helical backbone metal receptor [Bacteroidetes bacterium]|nr:helical backbone metal receptor [Bacteroidota bacterium]